MARNTLLLSPSYGKTALPETRERNALLVECLTEDYLFLGNDVQNAIVCMQNKGYVKTLSEHRLTEGRMILRNVWRYFNENAFREQTDAFLATHKKGDAHGRYLGIACLRRDRPDLDTWDQVMRAMDALSQETGQDAPGAERDIPQDETPARQPETAPAPPDTDTKTPLESVLLQLAEVGEVMRRIAVHLRAYTERQRRQEENDRNHIADLQSENARLRQRIEILLTQGHAAAQSASHITDQSEEIAYQLMLAEYRLPETTIVSATGWSKVLHITYARERGAFCDRLQSDDYSSAEKSQIVKALRLLAQHGLRYPSLHTEVFRRPLPGVPHDIGDFNYCRASHNLRVSCKPTGDTLAVLGIHIHTSGGGSLPDIR